MTEQIGDSIIYKGLEYSVAGTNGGDLFKPSSVGLEVVWIRADCYRGFYYTYIIKNDRLKVKQFSCGLAEKDEMLAEKGIGPKVNGKIPTREKLTSESWDLDTGRMVSDTYWSDWCYKDVDIGVNFTGGLLLCADVIEEEYAHMVSYPAYKYKKVIEIKFEEGKLKSTADYSEKMANSRARLKLASKSLELSGPSRKLAKKEAKEWIQQTFSLDYSEDT